MRKRGSSICVAIVVVTWPAFGMGQVVQLPTVRTFGVQTTVTVPDRGAALLGGTTRSVLTPTRSRQSMGRAHVTARIIDLHEMDASVLAEARRRRAARASGENVVADKAAYLSTHVGGRPVQRHAATSKSGRSASHGHWRARSRTLTYDELMRRGCAAMASGRYREAKQYFLAAASGRP